jgi:pSer/pThr/pTyr-binding forkhead associated (FHA) protein
MPYIVIHSEQGQELGRRELSGLLIVGRSPDSDLRIHDIMLSREHCGIEEGDGGWVVVDLDSRNGTYVNGERVTRGRLADGDRLKVGQTLIEFHAGPMPETPRKAGLLERPADPFEALATTMAGFEFDPSFEPPIERPIVRPRPRPIPVANKAGASTTLATASALGTEQHLGSSPTWAAKPMRSPMREVLEHCLPEPVAAPDPAPVIRTQPASPLADAWRRRVAAMIGEVLATAALAGTLLLIVLAVLS